MEDTNSDYRHTSCVIGADITSHKCLSTTVGVLCDGRDGGDGIPLWSDPRDNVYTSFSLDKCHFISIISPMLPLTHFCVVYMHFDLCDL